MTTIPFPQSAEGEPTRLRRKVGFQHAVGIPARDAALVDFLSNGGPMSVGPGYIEQANILGSVERGAALPAAYNLTTGPLDLGDLDPGSPGHARFLASFFHFHLSSNPSGAHYRHRLGRGLENEGGVAAVPGPLTLVDDSNIGFPMRWIDVLCSGLTLACQSKQNLRLTAAIVAGKFDLWGATTQVTGAGVTGDGLPILRHTWPGNYAENIDPTFDAAIRVKVISASAGTIRVKMGAAETYSGRTLTVEEGGWIYLYGTYDLSTVYNSLGAYPLAADDGSIGRRQEQLQLYVGDISGWADDDEFEVAPYRAVWTPDLAVQRLLAETQCRFFLDSGEVAIDNGWTLQLGRQTAETRFAAGAGAQPVGSRVTGFLNATLQVERRLVDNSLLIPLMNLLEKPVVIEALHDAVIGSTTTPYGVTMVAPTARYEGTVYSVPAGGGDPAEQLSFTLGAPAEPYTLNSVDYPGAFEIVLDTDLANPFAVGLPPVNTVLPGITGTPTEDETLTSTTGTWTGDAVIAFARQWKRDGIAIAGATGTTYMLVLADVGSVITVTVTATNEAGSASATSAATATIAGA